MELKIVQYHLNFKQPGGTSRGILHQKETYFLWASENGQLVGVSECPLFRGLSADDSPDFESKLQEACAEWQSQNFHSLNWIDYPSIRFGIELLDRSVVAKHPFDVFPSAFVDGQAKIPINGLIWMGDLDFMQNQIDSKLEEGFNCIKLKIGALDFDAEWALIHKLRKRYAPEDLIIRVDANGAFAPEEAFNKMDRLSKLKLHSIEQPIQSQQWETMERLCRKTPLAIALDEELIGVHSLEDKKELLQAIRPQYIILKPGLLGGFSATQEWIDLAEKRSIGWWITSALESNIGLNAIAQWTSTLDYRGHQGLGTGGLFTNNPDGFLTVKNGYLEHRKLTPWNLNT